MLCTLWLCWHTPVVCHSQNAAYSSLVLSPVPHNTTPLSPDLAMNTAISFSTTTTWQAYAGENTMSYFSQMVGLCAQNFLAGAAGLAVGCRLYPRSSNLPETSVSARAIRNNSGLMARVVILGNAPESRTPLMALATEGEISELSSRCAPSCSPAT